MAYQFTKDLETGNISIDVQHKELITAINNLLDACGQGKGRTQIVETARFLENYTIKHFADEEKLQIQSKYPDYTNHKQLHESFKKTVAQVIKKLEAQGPTVVLVGEINSILAGWLINHIKREDKKLAEHIKNSK